MPTFTKDLLRPGRYRLADGTWVTFTRPQMAVMQSRVREMLSAGIGIPICLEHLDRAKPMSLDDLKAAKVRDVVGWIDGADLEPDGTLRVRCEVPDEADARTVRANRFVSPEVCPGFVDGHGRRWRGPLIAHCAVTPWPVQNHQEPFRSVALGRGVHRVFRLSLADRSTTMKTTTVRKPLTRADLVAIAAKARRKRARLSATRLSADLPGEEQPLSLDQLANRCSELREAMSRLEQRVRLQPLVLLQSPSMSTVRMALESCLRALTDALEQTGLAVGLAPTAAVAMSRPTARPTDDQAVKAMLQLAGIGR